MATQPTSGALAALPEDLYAQGCSIYKKFVDRVKVLLGITSADFGLCVLRPSNLLELQAQLAGNTPEQRDELIDLCNNTNAEIKLLMQSRGGVVTQFYNEYNRRGIAAGPSNWSEADVMFRTQGARLMASFKATPEGKLLYTGLVPCALLLESMDKTVTDFLPCDAEKVYLRAYPTKAVNTFIALPDEQTFTELYSKAVKVGSTAGVPVIILPDHVYEEEVSNFMLT